MSHQYQAGESVSEDYEAPIRERIQVRYVTGRPICFLFIFSESKEHEHFLLWMSHLYVMDSNISYTIPIFFGVCRYSKIVPLQIRKHNKNKHKNKI